MQLFQKKRYLLFIPVILIFTLPYLINLRSFRTFIEESIREDYSVNLRIEKLSWDWFPSPNISAHHASVEHNGFDIFTEDIDLYPDILSLLTGSLTITRVVCESPEISINSYETLKKLLERPSEPKTTTEIIFPSLKLEIINGTLTPPVDGPLAPLLQATGSPPVFSDIQIVIASEEHHIEAHVALNAPGISGINSSLTITRPPSADNSNEDGTHCSLEVTTNTIDLNLIRMSVLKLSNMHPTIREIAEDIILGGTVSKSNIVYSGPVNQLADPDRISVTAVADNATIHIPETRLTLKKASGPISFKDSILSGKDLSAQLGNTLGKNGRFSLGLKDSDDSFTLDVDLEADLSELTGTIDEFIDNPDIREGFSSLRDLTGKAAANLKLGNSLSDIDVHVHAPAVSGTFYYNPLQRFITVRQGELDINPDSVSWRNLICDIGPNAVTNAQGTLNWKSNPVIALTIPEIRVSTPDTFECLTSFPEISSRLKPVISRVDGDITLQDFSLNGNLNTPERMNYQFNATTETLILDSPLLPDTLSTSFSAVAITRDTISIPDAVTVLDSHTINCSARLKHIDWTDLSGTLTLSGIVPESYAPWLKEKKWIPKPLFPKLPCKLKPLNIHISESGISLDGTLIHDRGKDSIETSANITVTNEGTQIKHLEIKTEEETAELTACFPAESSIKTTELSFNGQLSKSTVDNLLERSRRLSGSLSGDFHLIIPESSQGPIRLTGPVNIDNLKLNLKNNGNLGIDTMKLKGQGTLVDISLDMLTFNRPDHLSDVLPAQLIVPELKGGLSLMKNREAKLDILSGNLCGINFSGGIELPSKRLNTLLSTESSTLTFEELFSCFGITHTQITGTVSINSTLNGTPDTLTDGTITLRASNGVVKRAALLSKILSLTDLTELFTKNPIKNLMTEGYRYDVIEIDATITGHNVHISRAIVIGAGLNLYGNGYIDLETMSLDLVVMASPFKAADSLLTKLPVIKRFAKNNNKSILSVPIKVEGSIGSPTTRFLPKRLSTVSTGILDSFVNTFKVPFEFSYKLVTPSMNKPAEQNGSQTSDPGGNQ